MNIIHYQPSEASSTKSIMCGLPSASPSGFIRPLKNKLYTDEKILIFVKLIRLTLRYFEGGCP